MTQSIRVALDVSFIAIAILLFYMWAVLSEKYRKVRDENIKLKEAISEKDQILK